MYLIANQRGHKGHRVSCFAVSGVPKPYMLESTWDLYKDDADLRSNGNHKFTNDSYIPTLEAITQEDTVVLNFSLF